VSRCVVAAGIATADSESKASDDADVTSRDSGAEAEEECPSPLGDAAASVASPHAEMLAAAAALRDDPVVQKLIATVSAAAPSSDESVQTMEALLQNPLVYGLVTSAGLEWCQRDVDETAESAVVQCWQHHAARSLTFRQGSAGKTRVSGYVAADVTR
jgi:hypothetical protein